MGCPLGFGAVKVAHLQHRPGVGYVVPLLALFFPIISCLTSSLLVS